MSKNSSVIVLEIFEYLSGCTGKYFSDYYAGITNDPKERLFTEHNVDEQYGCWIYRKAVDIDNARNAEKRLIEKGMKGGDGGGDDSSLYVYSYLITNQTKE